MGPFFLISRTGLVGSLVLVSVSLASAAKPTPPAKSAPAVAVVHNPVAVARNRVLAPETVEAARLTAQAIAARAAGEEDRRQRLLEQAIEVAPDYALAHWQRGEVFFEEKWRTPEAVAQRVAQKESYADYLQYRATADPTPVGHEELAQWCYRQGLEYQERYHWVNVLNAIPTHPMGRERMRVQPYAGALYTPEDIAALELKAAAAQAKFNELRPKFLELAQRVAAGKEDDAAPALEELRRVADLGAIPAFESAVAEVNADQPAETALLLSHCVVDALGRVDHPQTTRRLLDYAVFAEHPDLRAAAAANLKTRPLTDYVPQLMGALTAPVQARIGAFVNRGEDFTALFSADYYQAGPLADVTSSSTHVTRVVQIGGRYGPNGSDGPNTAARKASVETSAAAAASRARQQVRQTNLQIAERNLRIREVLSNVFEGDLGEDPRAYWESWTAYNELHMPEHPVYQISDSTQNTYCEIMSCFAPGTLVWTQTGSRPIEQIVPGEMVLSQNPSTGELAYRTVLDRTVRPPTAMVSVGTEGEPIVTTLGHRFWANGKGWVMAKLLDQNAAIHSLDGTTKITGIQSVPRQSSTEAYNLVIDDFHTFFVGESRLLVHDNSCPAPTASKTPGQAASEETLVVIAANLPDPN